MQYYESVSGENGLYDIVHITGSTPFDRFCVAQKVPSRYAEKIVSAMNRALEAAK